MNVEVNNAEELLQLLNRANSLSNKLEETLQCINNLNSVVKDVSHETKFLDTSEGSVTDSILKSITMKLQTVLEKLS